MGRALGRDELSDAVIARFHAKYQTAESCWPWQGSKTPKGYGQIHLCREASGKIRNEYAHRVAYVLAKGDIPAGLVVRHDCDNPTCVNPAHLLIGTQADNVNDAAVKGHYNGPRPQSRARKLSDGDVAAIRMSNAKGVDLAKAYCVTRATISNVRNLRRRAA